MRIGILTFMIRTFLFQGGTAKHVYNFLTVIIQINLYIYIYIYI